MDVIPQVIWEGTFKLCGVELRCAVLGDGRRVINADDFHDLMEAMIDPTAVIDQSEVRAFARWKAGG